MLALWERSVTFMVQQFALVFAIRADVLNPLICRARIVTLYFLKFTHHLSPPHSPPHGRNQGNATPVWPQGVCSHSRRIR
jgi:hypothetical protein